MFQQHLTALLLSVSLGYSVVGYAAGPAIGTLGSVVGKAQIVRNGKNIPATKGMDVFATDKLVTSEKTAVKINFKDGGNFIAFENAQMTIEEYKTSKEKGGGESLKSAFEIAKGKVRFFVKPQANGKVDAKYKTPNAVMGIRGTSGFIDATDPNKTQLVVLSGKVEVSNPIDPTKTVLVPPNFMTDVVGAATPTAPKAAPVMLLNNLNTEATRVDPNIRPETSAPAAGSKPAAEPAPAQTPAAAPASEGASKEKPATKKTVYAPDGSSSVIVNDSQFDQLKAAAPSTVVAPNTASQLQQVQQATKATDQIKEVNSQVTKAQEDKVLKDTVNIKVNVGKPK